MKHLLGVLIYILLLLCPCFLADDQVIHSGSAPHTPSSNETHTGGHYGSTVIFAVIVLCMLACFVLQRFHWVFIPESGVIIAIGAIIGVFLRIGHEELSDLLVFDADLFFEVLLPLIIFDSGYSLRKRYFFLNFGSILVFAVVGTIIATLITGFSLLYLGIAGLSYELNFAEAFAFGALISAIDPVATLAVFMHVDAPDGINALVFGESVLNDAVAIVLYRTFEGFDASGGVGKEIGLAFGKFLYTSLGSTAIGLVFALAFALLTKHTQLRKFPLLEMSLLLSTAYLCYVLNEAIKLSGIAALLFCGIAMSHYAFYNLSPESRVTSRQVTKVLALMSEITLFAFLGMSVFSQEIDYFSWPIIGWTFLLCLVARVFNIIPLSFLLNRARKPESKITWRDQLVLWFAGLRGCIAFGLAIGFPRRTDEMYNVIVSTTLFIVIITTLLFGSGTLPLLRVLKLSKTPQQQPENDTLTQGLLSGESTQDVTMPYVSMSTAHATTPEFSPSRQKTMNWFTRLDEGKLRPFFIHPDGLRASAARPDIRDEHL